MLDIVKTYFDAADAITARYTGAVEEERTKLAATAPGAERNKAEVVYGANIAKLRRLRDASREMERAKLALTTDDALIGWMLEHCTSYPDHMEIVLKALPLNLEGLRQLKADNAWCGDFDDLLRQAVRAGVVDDGRSPQRRELEEWLRRNFSVTQRYMDELHGRVDQVVAAEAAAYLAPQKKPHEGVASEA